MSFACWVVPASLRSVHRIRAVIDLLDERLRLALAITRGRDLALRERQERELRVGQLAEVDQAERAVVLRLDDELAGRLLREIVVERVERLRVITAVEVEL